MKCTLISLTNYWTQFAVNSKRAIETAVTNGDVLDFIMTIGGTLHTVQDFYTHSNWVDSHYRTECDCYRSETWVETMHSVNGDFNALLKDQSAIHTYSYGDCDENSRNCLGGQLPHGDACMGINKDSYLSSYGFAFSASVEWLDNIHQWAGAVGGNSIISQAKNYTPPSQEEIDDMNDLDDYLHTVSYAIKFRDTDGHWKGPGSGSLKRFVPAQVEFSASKSVYKSRYLDQKIYLRWSEPNVYDFPDVDASQSVDTTTITGITRPYSGIEQFTPVVVRTVAVRGNDKINTPSYFATVNIDGMEFVETVLIDQYDFTPYWTSIKFVNTSATPTVPIAYTLKNNHYPESDDVVSITQSGSNSLTLSFDVATHALSGDVTGTFDSIDNTFTTKNNDTDVNVQLFITANKISDCKDGLPQQYCRNEAYTWVGVFDECSGETIPSTSGADQLPVAFWLTTFITCFMFVNSNLLR